MTEAPNRLPPPGDRGFAQRDVDRNQPLRFRLNGRTIHGFAGDTVLSAALASGIVAAGTWHGAPIALDERFAPAIVPARNRFERSLALPMERTPAVDGDDLVTLGAPPPAFTPEGPLDRLARLAAGPVQTLAHRVERARLDAPWLDAEPQEEIAADLVVVGAGVAGLSAAIAAAQAGASVVILEQRPFAGGDAPCFGVIEDEETPDAAMTRLLATGVALANVRLYTRTLAFAVAPGGVRAHRVELQQGRPVGRHLRLRAPRIVLATGAEERLPLVAGNRMPGVVGSIAAFQRADRYGVWIGQRALVATAHSQAYRLAIRADDSGIAIANVVDVRPGPVSRFIDFCKASGIQPRFGETLARIDPPARRRGLRAHFAPVVTGGAAPEPQWVDQLVTAAGWQPAIALWLAAGGTCEWSAPRRALVATGALPGIVLAGAVAGWVGTSACAQSGEAATAALFGRPLPAIEEREVDATFESPDGAMPAILPDARGQPAFLGGGPSLVTVPPRPGRRRRLLPHPAERAGLAQRPVALSLGDVAGGVDSGALDAAMAPAVAAARVRVPLRLGGRPPAAPADAAAPAGPALPVWLAGRFGADAQLWWIASADPRLFEPGSLIFPDFESTSPLAAVGVVVRSQAGEGAVAITVGRRFSPGGRLIVRDAAGAVEATIRHSADGDA